MIDIQEIIKILAPITLLITAIAGFLNAIIKSVEIIKKYLSQMQPGFRILFLTITQIVPVGCVIWNFMYFASIYSERLVEKVFFLLIVIYPTLLICSYEAFWGVSFYPKILSRSRTIESGASISKSNQHSKNKKRSKS
jgi:hypothetical protein